MYGSTFLSLDYSATFWIMSIDRSKVGLKMEKKYLNSIGGVQTDDIELTFPTLRPRGYGGG